MTIMTNKGNFSKAAVLTALLTMVRDNPADATYHGVAEDGVEYDVPASDAETVLMGMIEQLEKPRVSKLNPDNEQDSATILTYLRENDAAYTATEILTAVSANFVGSTSNQRASSLLKKLAETGAVEKITDKRKTLWRAIAE